MQSFEGRGLRPRENTAGMTQNFDEPDSDWRTMPAGPGWRQHPVRSVFRLFQVIGAIVCLIGSLTILAAVPGLNLCAAGYLLGAQARVGRTGRFRDALILLPAASRVLMATMAVVLCLWPVGWMASVVREAWMISDGNTTVWSLTIILIILSLLLAAHVSRAIHQGARLREFLRVDRTLRWIMTWGKASGPPADPPRLSNLLPTLQIGHHLRLGLWNYAAVYLVLALPTWLYSAMSDQSRITERILMITGAITLTVLLAIVPFQIVHMAASDRLMAVFDLRTGFRRFRNAPFAHLSAVVLLYGLSVLLPLYQALVKLQIPPHGIVWDVMLVAIVLTLPGRLLVGWACFRGDQTRNSWRIWRWLCGIGILVAMGTYVWFLMLAASGGALGSRVLWQHHALLLPWPV